MTRILTDNLGWKLLSLLCAFALWIGVARDPELATTVSVPILFNNIPDDLDVASGFPERIHLEIKGNSRRLTPESLSGAEVVLDLAALQPGERTFTISERNIRGLPVGVSFSRAVPSQVVLQFEHMISKDLTIEPAYGKSPPDGYTVMNYTFDPPKVRVRGPEGRVQSIDHVTTDHIDLSDVVSKAERHVQVRVGDPEVRLESAPVVKFTVELGKINKE